MKERIWRKLRQHRAIRWREVLKILQFLCGHERCLILRQNHIAMKISGDEMSRKPRLTGVIVLLTIVVMCALPWAIRKHQYSARKAWKEQAIPEIAKFANDAKLVSEEIALLK